jgi:hypothetical protein
MKKEKLYFNANEEKQQKAKISLTIGELASE